MRYGRPFVAHSSKCIPKVGERVPVSGIPQTYLAQSRAYLFMGGPVRVLAFLSDVLVTWTKGGVRNDI